jgi:dienelactone hydrolase
MALFVVVALVPGATAKPIPRLVVTPARALTDTPVNIRVTGLTAGQAVALTANTVDYYGNRWASRLPLKADSRGVVETKSNMKLFWSMTPTKNIPQAQRTFLSKDEAMPVQLNALVGGRVVATGTLMRSRIAADLKQSTTTLGREGFVGTFAIRPDRPPAPATLVLGGSNPGYFTSLSLHLASNGYPSLSVGYWGMPGLPQTLENVPLEYFEKALRWLAAQPGVDPNRMAVIGLSRGEEAALLLAMHYPKLVHASVGCTGSEAVLAGFPSGPSAWTLGGKPVPLGAIPVEQIAGPVLVTGGGEDQIWPSALAVQRMVSRARTHGKTNLAGDVYPSSGHGIGCLLPNQPLTGLVEIGPNTFGSLGGTPVANEQATVKSWPRLLRFLRDTPATG